MRLNSAVHSRPRSSHDMISRDGNFFFFSKHRARRARLPTIITRTFQILHAIFCETYQSVDTVGEIEAKIIEELSGRM